MRVALVRHVATTDHAVMASVEAGRWLQHQGVNPGLVARESLPTVSDYEWRVLAWIDDWTPRMGGLTALTDYADFKRMIAKLRRRYAKELASGKVPARAGQDVVCFVSPATLDALAPLLGVGVPTENVGAIWVLEAVAGEWRVTANWPGRAPGDPAPRTAPTPRIPRDASAGRAKGRPGPDRPWEEYLRAREEELAAGDTPLLDAHGQRLPGRPLVGLAVDVQWGPNVCLFSRLEIMKVEGGQFCLERIAGGEVRFDVEHWDSWLRRRLEEGVVTVHLPECAIGWCSGCDGGVVGRETYPGEAEAVAAGRAVPR